MSRSVIVAILGLAFFIAASKPTLTDLTLISMTGEKVHLRDLRGKAVVVNFWATWCGPCREEMPMMVEAEKVWGPKGVIFIGASLDDNKTKKDIVGFVNQFHIDFPIWTGATLTDLGKLRLGNAVPDTVFVDTDGAIFARVRGEIRREELDARLEWVTGNRSGAAPEALVTHLDTHPGK